MDFGLVYPALVAGRLLLAFAPLPDALKHDHQLSSPLTSYPRLQEGVYLFQHGIDPYSGGLFRHSPLLLSLFSTALPLNKFTSACLWTACDAISAWALVKIWRARQRVSQSSRDSLIAAIYLLNPYLLLPTLALSTSTIENMLFLLSLMFASQGQSSPSLLALALLVQLSLPSAIFIVPMILLLLSDPVSRLASPREFNTYLSSILAKLGLWWYFFTEMFDHFRPFFLMVFSAHLLIYVLPVCLKFQHDILYATYILAGVYATFKPYPTLSDPGLFISLISLFPETYQYLRYPIVTTLLHLHSALLLPLFHHLWLSQGTGNANFFYASTLVFGVSNGAALLDAIWAGLRIAVGNLPEGYELIQK
ncbi:unnamed protein product [Somion occarium]|uniref:PIG-U-domain-containing protein n=1 Tax=Somion occarium TaxID=3059160 RepID=A0ABP1E0M7_9APHY